MPVSEHMVVINKPIDLVFRNVTCMKGCVNWLTSIMKAEKLSDGPVQVGTQYRETYKFMGRLDDTVITVKLYNPPYEFAFEDPSIPLEWHYTFEEVPGGTRVHATLTMSPTYVGALDGDTVAARAQNQFDIDLNNLKTMLESGVTVNVD